MLESVTINTIHIMIDAAKWTHITIFSVPSFATKINAFQNSSHPVCELPVSFDRAFCILTIQNAVTFIYLLSENDETFFLHSPLAKNKQNSYAHFSSNIE